MQRPPEMSVQRLVDEAGLEAVDLDFASSGAKYRSELASFIDMLKRNGEPPEALELWRQKLRRQDKIASMAGQAALADLS